MGDLMKPENRGKLALGAGGIVGGLAVWGVMGLVAHQLLPAVIIGGLVIWGSWRLFQNPTSALVGMVGLAAGVLLAAAGLPLVGGLASLLLGISGLGLVAGGAFAVWQVFKNRRS